MQNNGGRIGSSKITEQEIALIRTGYVRGILGLPLTVADAGLTQSQLRDKYRKQLESDACDRFVKGTRE